MAKNKKVTIKGNVTFNDDKEHHFGAYNNGTIIVNGNITGKGLLVGFGMKGTIKAQEINAKYVGPQLRGGTITAKSIKATYVGSEMKGGTISAENIEAGQVGNKMQGGTIKATGAIKATSVGLKMQGGTIKAGIIRFDIINREQVKQGKISADSFWVPKGEGYILTKWSGEEFVPLDKGQQ